MLEMQHENKGQPRTARSEENLVKIAEQVKDTPKKLCKENL